MLSMAGSEPLLTVLLYSALAVAAAALGVLPFALRLRVPLSALGMAYATASGLMIGAGYLLVSEGMRSSVPQALAGAALGVIYTLRSQSFAGLRQLSHDPQAESGPNQGFKLILRDALHSASEGVAIGVAMAAYPDLRMGIFIALALAVHNIAEAMALTAQLNRGGVALGRAAGLCLLANSSQILLAAVAFVACSAYSQALPAALGFASGALVFLVMTELLPASYRRAGKSRIAFLLSLSAGAVVLLEDFFV